MDTTIQKRNATSARMRACKNRNTSIELALRRALWHEGYRYKVDVKALPGRPDIVLSRYKLAIFCDGKFWHGKDWVKRRDDFKANKEFWIAKIERNMQRDIEVNQALSAAGWRVLRFWERDIKKDLQGCVNSVHRAIETVKTGWIEG